MKKIFLFTFSFLLFSAFFAQNNIKSLGEFFYNVPLKKQISLTQFQTEWWSEYTEWPVHENLFKTLLDKIDSGKIQIMIPKYPFTSVMNRSEVDTILHEKMYQYVQNVETGELETVYVRNDFYTDKISSISFYEEWFFDESTMAFTKKIKGFTVNQFKIDQNTGENIGEVAIFFIPTDKLFNLNQDAEKNPSDLRSVPFITYNFSLNGYLDDNTLMLEKSQLQFCITKINAATDNNKSAIRDTLFPYTSKPDKKTLPELIKKMGKANNLKFYEEWNFDVNRLTFEKKVKGIVLTDKKNVEIIETGAMMTVNKEIAFIALNGFVPIDMYKTVSVNVEKQSFSLQFANFYLNDSYFKYTKLANADSAKMMAVAVTVANKVKHHKVNAYPKKVNAFWDDPWNPEIHIPKNSRDVDSVFTWRVDHIDNYVLYDGIDDTAQLRMYLSYSQLSGFKFYESWKYDFTTNNFEKNIKALALNVHRINESTGEAKGMTSLFTIDIPPSTNIAQPQYLIGQNICSTVGIDFDIANPLDLGIIDWYESWNENLYQFQYYPLIQGIINGVIKGEIKAIDPVTNKPIKKEEVIARLNSLKDSTFIKGGDLPTDYTLVDRIVFNEDWYFNPETLQFYKKVNSITFVNAKKTYNQELQKEEWKVTPLFTINLN